MCHCLLYTQLWLICLVSFLVQMKFLTWMLFILFSGTFLFHLPTKKKILSFLFSLLVFYLNFTLIHNSFFCSMFALLSLHMFMYGCNLFTWKHARINYNFIFEYQSSTALKYRDAFLICTTTMTAVVGALVIHLILGLTGFSPVQVDSIPGLLLLVSSSIPTSITTHHWFSHVAFGLYITNFLLLSDFCCPSYVPV